MNGHAAHCGHCSPVAPALPVAHSGQVAPVGQANPIQVGHVGQVAHQGVQGIPLGQDAHFNATSSHSGSTHGTLFKLLFTAIRVLPLYSTRSSI